MGITSRVVTKVALQVTEILQDQCVQIHQGIIERLGDVEGLLAVKLLVDSTMAQHPN